MDFANVRRTRSVTKIPVSVTDLTAETVDIATRSDGNAKNLTSKNAQSFLTPAAAANSRRSSLSSAIATVTLKDPLERQMDSSLETVFRRWDTETTSVAIAEGSATARPPTTMTNGGNIGGSRMSATRSKQKPRVSRLDDDRLSYVNRSPAAEQCSVLNIGSPNDTANGLSVLVERRLHADSNNNTNNGLNSVNGVSSRLQTSEPPNSQSSGCASTGNSHHNVFRIEFDATGYDPEDITVLVTGSRLTVHGVRRETDDPDGTMTNGGLRRTTTEFCRRIRLPDDVDRDGLTCVMVGGQLIVQAPRTISSPQTGNDSFSFNRNDDTRTMRGLSADMTSSMNTPTVRSNEDGTVREMSLCIDVGRIFRPDDVTVKVKNSTLTLTVVAERVEGPSTVQTSASADSLKGSAAQNETVSGTNEGNTPVITAGSWRRLNANLNWEFDMPGPVEMDTLKAGLTVEGLLRISARMKKLQQNEPAR